VRQREQDMLMLEHCSESIDCQKDRVILENIFIIFPRLKQINRLAKWPPVVRTEVQKPRFAFHVQIFFQMTDRKKP